MLLWVPSKCGGQVSGSSSSQVAALGLLGPVSKSEQASAQPENAAPECIHATLPFIIARIQDGDVVSVAFGSFILRLCRILDQFEDRNLDTKPHLRRT
jgi:hypothetical protein